MFHFCLVIGSIVISLNAEQTSTLTCPVGTEQVGGLNADIAGCGIEGCNKRYQDRYPSIDDCRNGCNACSECNSFTWAPINGDQNHPGQSVCTLYRDTVPNRQWAPNQIMCKLLQCPSGSKQIGELNADIAGCGLEGCDDRYNKQDILECEDHCLSNMQCKSYTWAPLDGDRNHPGERVCTIYATDEQNRVWSPNQILCQPNSRRSAYNAYFNYDNQPGSEKYSTYVIELSNPYFVLLLVFAAVAIAANLICLCGMNKCQDRNQGVNKYRKVRIDSDTDLNEAERINI